MRDTAIEIRHAGIADVTALSDIGQTSFRAAYAGAASSEDLESHLRSYFSAAAIGNELDSHDRTYLIATVDNQPAGFAKFRSGACPDEIPEKNCIELQQLYVAPGNQRHGLGARLLQATVLAARSELAAGIWLSAWEHADWAIDFYRKNEFEQIGTIDFKLGATDHTDLLLWLPLASRGCLACT